MTSMKILNEFNKYTAFLSIRFHKIRVFSLSYDAFYSVLLVGLQQSRW